MAINAVILTGQSHSWHVGFALRIRFQEKKIDVTAPLPSDPLWQAFDKIEFEDEK